MNYQKGGVYTEKQETYPPARFVMLPSKDKVKSLEAGHEVCVDKVFIEILKQGGAINTFAVNDDFKARYPDQWKAFEAGLEVPKTGMPLGNWPGCTRAECENLKRVNLFTVEDLAEASEAAFESYGMGARALNKKAKEYLIAAKDNSAVIEKMAKLESKLDFLESRNSELEGLLRQELDKEDKPKRGRPRKE